MQITSGMPGAFGNAAGSLDPGLASLIASDYRYNIAYGARILAAKWKAVPKIGNGDPAVLENWYYAIWAYNGWGWVNNPNNPRFSRQGTPGSDPNNFPYQERVLYLVAHPPHDSSGSPLWKAIPIALPSPSSIGRNPKSFVPKSEHVQPGAGFDAIYSTSIPPPVKPLNTEIVRLRITNTGSQAWLSSGDNAISLIYDLLTSHGNPFRPLSPFSPGVLAYGQNPVVVPRDVLPGQTVTMKESIRAPAKPGNYRVVWDLQRGTSDYLSQDGVMPSVRTLRVRTRGTVMRTGKPAPGPTATPQPAEDLRYMADTAIPDGSLLKVRSRFTKGWMVFNAGTRAWTGGFTLKQTSGAYFGRRRIAVPAAAACRAVNVTAKLRAPKTTGAFFSGWKLQDPSGRLVGDRLTIKVSVRSTAPTPTPGPSPTPTSGPATPGPSPTPTPVG
ncbi:MAG: NBR1-Ig-like domain-containing protein [Chloroflexota bacterium]